jgi:hypothetical protein
MMCYTSFEFISTESIIKLKYSVHQTEILHLHTSIKEMYILSICTPLLLTEYHANMENTLMTVSHH